MNCKVTTNVNNKLKFWLSILSFYVFVIINPQLKLKALILYKIKGKRFK
jgi:hypothetical protein